MGKTPPEDTHDAVMERLVSEHQLALKSFLRGILPGVREVSDILQEVNIIIWNKRADFQPGTNFKAWAFVIARYAAMDAQRKYKRNAWLVYDCEVLDTLTAEFESEGEPIDPKKIALTHCLSTLRQDDLNLLRHRYMSKVKLDAYAARVNRSLTAVRVRLHKLRIKLRQCIEQRMKGDSNE